MYNPKYIGQAAAPPAPQSRSLDQTAFQPPIYYPMDVYRQRSDPPSMYDRLYEEDLALQVGFQGDTAPLLHPAYGQPVVHGTFSTFEVLPSPVYPSNIDFAGMHTAPTGAVPVYPAVGSSPPLPFPANQDVHLYTPTPDPAFLPDTSAHSPLSDLPGSPGAWTGDVLPSRIAVNAGSSHLPSVPMKNVAPPPQEISIGTPPADVGTYGGLEIGPIPELRTSADIVKRLLAEPLPKGTTFVKVLARALYLDPLTSEELNRILPFAMFAWLAKREYKQRDLSIRGALCKRQTAKVVSDMKPFVMLGEGRYGNPHKFVPAGQRDVMRYLRVHKPFPSRAILAILDEHPELEEARALALEKIRPTASPRTTAKPSGSTKRK